LGKNSMQKLSPAPACFEKLERRTLLSAGQLDTSFGQDGCVSPQRQDSQVAFGDLSVLPDGRILAAEQSLSRSSLARFLADGSPDTSFGNDAADPGVVTTGTD